jgi:hypothetical protein
MRRIEGLCACAAIALSFFMLSGCASTTGLPKNESAEAGTDAMDPLAAARGRLKIKAPSARAEKKPLVLVHYMPWYQAPPIASGYGFHWHQGGAVFDPFATLPDGRANIASTYYPLTGPYDSRDPKALEYQVALMKMSGIDGVIFDWYGIEDALDYKPIQESTLAMIEVLKKAGLKFAICYEDQSVGKMIEAKGLAKADALAEGEKTFAWMAKNWFGDKAYVTYEGRPVVLCFGPQYFKDPSQWGEIFSQAEKRPWFVCLDDQGGKSADGSYDWLPMWASEGGILSPLKLVSYLNGFYDKQSASPFLVATAFPGFNDIYQKAGSGRSYGFLDYDKGETFKLTVDAAMEARPDILQIATWNDFGEGTVIEPTIEHGYAELEYLQDLRKGFEGDFPYDYSDLRAPIELFKASQGAAGEERQKPIRAAYDAIFAGDATAYRKALKAAKIATDFGVNPYLRDPAASSAAASGASGAYDPAGRKNLALGMPVVFSSNIYAFTGGKAVDGDLSSYWEGAANSYPGSLTVDLVSPQSLGTAVLRLNPKQIWGARTQRIEVLASDDGQDFRSIVPERDYLFDPLANGNSVAIPLGLRARFLKIVFTANSGGTAGQIAELEVYGE